ncbi:hypothetical protein SAMN05660841_01307 [Sphingobacterium nematocida]|uniref:Membrane or secreted protein n=2 Tax=Sphingobacterium nematocida TaxID=1513896 RepID=A0A1T5CBH6_9SPHI|nr:hypothetical protein SAMN05660841_01307 [Sphingobacterium nematocida]
MILIPTPLYPTLHLFNQDYVTLSVPSTFCMQNILFIILAAVCFTSQAQTKQLVGAFAAKQGDTTHLWLFVDNYSSHITYKDRKYIGTEGGPFTFDGQIITVQTEYNDIAPQLVGSELKIPTKMQTHQLVLDGIIYKRKTSKPQDLDGLWRITGRQSDAQMSQIPKSSRKTIKIMIDGFFQWIAINPAVKGFYGTGGGHYSFSNTAYTEHILFFSRDNTRVGVQLDFKGELKQGQWHHSGNSSKGDPIYEIWSKEI